MMKVTPNRVPTKRQAKNLAAGRTNRKSKRVDARRVAQAPYQGWFLETFMRLTKKLSMKAETDVVKWTPTPTLASPGTTVPYWNLQADMRR